MGLLLIGTRREHVVFWGIVSARRCGIGLRLHVSCRCWPKGPPPTSDAPPLTFACVIASRWRTSWVSLSAPFCPALLVLDRVPVNLLLSLHELCSKYVEKNWRGKHIAVDKFWYSAPSSTQVTESKLILIGYKNITTVTVERVQEIFLTIIYFFTSNWHRETSD